MISRRDFLRLAALGAGALAFRPFQRFTFLPIGTTIMVNLFSSRAASMPVPRMQSCISPVHTPRFIDTPYVGTAFPGAFRGLPEGCPKDARKKCFQIVLSVLPYATGESCLTRAVRRTCTGSPEVQSLDKLRAAQSGKIPHRHPGMGYAAHGFGYFRRIERAGVFQDARSLARFCLWSPIGQNMY